MEVAGPQLSDRRTIATIIDDIKAQIQRFLLVRLVTAIVVALATWMLVIVESIADYVDFLKPVSRLMSP